MALPAWHGLHDLWPRWQVAPAWWRSNIANARVAALVRVVNLAASMRTVLVVAVTIIGCSRHSKPSSGAFDPAETVHHTDGAVKIEAHRHDVPLVEMPIIAQTLWGLPMSGMATVAIDLSVPTVDGRNRYRQATGSIALICPKGCTLGNDHAKLELGGLGSVDFGHLAFESIDIRAAIHNGHAEITSWNVRSNDVQLQARMRIDLDDTALDASTIDGCLRFKPTPALLAAQPKTAALLMTTGASQNRDGFFSIRITGTLGASKRLAQDCGAI